MAVRAKHKFESQKADGPDATIVRPSNWNDDHDILMAGDSKLLGRQATGDGLATEISLGAGLAMVGGVLSASGGVTRQVFTASGTWTKPAGLSPNSLVRIRGWGGGGGAGRGAQSNQSPTGGGGGGYIEIWKLLSELNATETVTIGAGGNGGASAGANGVAGGNTSFGSHGTAYGGGPGAPAQNQGGEGGSYVRAGTLLSPAVASPDLSSSTNTPAYAGDASTVNILMLSAWRLDQGGAGGGIFAGALKGGDASAGGGGGGSAGAQGGKSLLGGNGGNSVSGQTAGVIPGGGGAAGPLWSANGGAGARGEVEVTIFAA